MHGSDRAARSGPEGSAMIAVRADSIACGICSVRRNRRRHILNNMAPSTTMLLLALFFGIVGVAGVHIVERRRFYRRNPAGVEEFSSYGKMVVSRGLEGVLHGTSRLCIAAALGLLCMFGIVRYSENNDLTKHAHETSSSPDKPAKRRRPAPPASERAVARPTAPDDGRGANAHHPGL